MKHNNKEQQEYKVLGKCYAFSLENSLLGQIKHLHRHLVNGSPVKVGGHEQIGLWLTTWHNAFTPQVPGQGSMHFWLTQASFSGHSELVTHSGLQVGGYPRNPGAHEQTDWPFTSLHWLLGPQGLGLHGFFGVSSEKSWSLSGSNIKSFLKYLVSANKVRKHSRRISRYRSTSVYGWSRCRLRFDRKSPDKGPDIYSWCTPCLVNSPCSGHTLVCSLCTGHLGIPAGRYRCRFCIGRSSRRVMGCMGRF